MNYLENYYLWKTNDFFDSKTKTETSKFDEKNNEEEIKDRFGTELSYSSNGMVGEVGIGTNRINIYTIGKMTASFVLFLVQKYGQNTCKSGGVVVTYGKQKDSFLFAKIASNVLSGFGIKVYLQKTSVPFSFVSYLISQLNAVAGIMIACDSEKINFNGIKFYSQSANELCDNDIDFLNICFSQIGFYNQIDFMGKSELINSVDFFNEYIKNTISQRTNENYQLNNNIKIAYLPIVNNEQNIIFDTLVESGFKSITKKDNISILDNRLQGIDIIDNIENNLDKSINLAKELRLDYAFATSLNHEKIMLAVKHNIDYVKLNSDEVALLILDYLTKKLDKTKLSKLSIIRTIDNSNIYEKIAKNFHIDNFDVICNADIGYNIATIKSEKNFEENNDDLFFGFNNNHELWLNRNSNEKDAVVSSLIIAEMISYYKYFNKDLVERLSEIYDEYGYYYDTIDEFDLLESAISVYEKIDNLKIRANTIFNPKRVVDFGKISQSKLKNENIIKYVLTDDSSVVVEGDEKNSKIKVYYSVCGENLKIAKQSQQKLHLTIRTLLDL